MNLSRHPIITCKERRALTHALAGLVSAILWMSSASADIIEIAVQGEITIGRDEQCLFGDATCVKGPNNGFLFAGAGIQIKSVWTFDTNNVPADRDSRSDFSVRSLDENWLDLSLTIFDTTRSFEFTASGFVDQPTFHRGVLNVTDTADESIYVEANHSRDFAFNLPQIILESKARISFQGLLSSDELTESLSWQSGDPGLGGTGEFDVVRCYSSSQDCDRKMGGTYRIDLLTVTNKTQSQDPVAVSEPATLPLLAAGLLLLVFVRRRPS